MLKRTRKNQPRGTQTRRATIEPLEGRKLMAADMGMEGITSDCEVQVFEIDREKVFPKEKAGPLAGVKVSWDQLYPGFPVVQQSSSAGDGESTDELTEASELPSLANVDHPVQSKASLESNLDEVLIGLSPIPVDAIENLREDIRDVAEIAEAVDGALGELEAATSGLGVGESPLEQLGGGDGQSSGKGWVPDPLSGLPERNDEDGPYTGIRPSGNISDHISGIASSKDKENEPHLVPGTEEKHEVDGGTEESYLLTDGTRVTTRTSRSEQGGLSVEIERTSPDGSFSVELVETNPDHIFMSRDTHGSDGRETYGEETIPLDRTQDPDAEPAAGPRLKGTGSAPDFSLDEPDEVNPDRSGEETGEAPRLAVDPRDLLVNPDPDAADGPTRELNEPLPPLQSPDQVLPPREAK